jgi:hypothetical protein
MNEFNLPRLFNWQLASQRIPYNIFTAKIDLTLVDTTSGLLEVGKQYFIGAVQPGDDFTNVGFPPMAVSGIFTATGTTPTDWSNGTVVTNMTDSQPVVNKLQDTIGVVVALEWISYNVQPPQLVMTFRKTNGFPESKFWNNRVDAIIRVNNNLLVVIPPGSPGPVVVSNNQVVISPGPSKVSDNQYEFRVYNT